MWQKIRCWFEKAEWPFWIGFLFFVVVVVSCVQLTSSAQQWLLDSSQLPVRYLEVEGNTQYVEDADVQLALNELMQKSFYALDVNEAQQKVEHLDWVYWAAIRKEWPATIKVNLVEQRPLVFWNGDFILNHQGQVFQADTSRLVYSLPALFGPEGEELKALQLFTDYSELLSLYGLKAKEMTMSERYAVHLTLSNDIKLNLGRENGIARIKRFLEFYPALIEQHQVEYVDLRYDTGFAVGEQIMQSETAG
ncbi:cell division protein FtsQ/DivIB [Catenovulum sediminis]|uniref:Cell division protein FtsQ n=1 Tax=Catenovulum sediminis TaxID=1740262 RepID=A0ABV1RG83_9ALTE|nr:cell division protein FtsQ/DivIB [Catenovulum sediminis]